LHLGAQSRREVLMLGPQRDTAPPKWDTAPGAPRPQGLPVPEPHNDVAPPPGQPKASALKDTPWLLGIGLGLILTVLWIGVLGWLAVRLLLWLLR